MQSYCQRRLLKRRIHDAVQGLSADDVTCSGRMEKVKTRGLNETTETTDSGGAARDILSPQPDIRTDVEDQTTVNDSHDDLLDPKSWSVRSRWFYTLIVASTGCLVSFASSIAAPTVPQAMKDYNVSEEVAILASATYFITFGLGTMVSAPLSEVFGRYVVMLRMEQ